MGLPSKALTSPGPTAGEILPPGRIGNGLVHLDWTQRRLWVRGQRVHHGLTGLLLTGAGLAGLAARDHDVRRSLGWAAVGSLLMAHDWKDRTIWFERGSGRQG